MTIELFIMLGPFQLLIFIIYVLQFLRHSVNIISLLTILGSHVFYKYGKWIDIVSF